MVSRRKQCTQFMPLIMQAMQMSKFKFIIFLRNFMGANSNIVNVRIFFCAELNCHFSSRLVLSGAQGGALT